MNKRIQSTEKRNNENDTSYIETDVNFKTII